MKRTYTSSDFKATEILLDQITKRPHAVCAQNDPATLDTLQRLIVVYDLFKQLLLSDSNADAGGLYPFDGDSPAQVGFESVQTALAALHEYAKPYMHYDKGLENSMDAFFQRLNQDFGH